MKHGKTCSRTYTPNANCNGVDTFTFQVNDGPLERPGATVTITVDIKRVPLASARGHHRVHFY